MPPVPWTPPRTPWPWKPSKRIRPPTGKIPGAFYLNAYAATLALVNAIEKSCSTDYADITAALRSEWVATPLGIIKFDERGDAIGVGFSMYQVQNGQYVEVK
jgi:branched-chain amino acid transport system substrate-binding protein